VKKKNKPNNAAKTKKKPRLLNSEIASSLKAEFKGECTSEMKSLFYFRQNTG
jgi:hypothetical protein